MITLGTKGNVRFLNPQTKAMDSGRVDCWMSANVVCIKAQSGVCCEVNKKDVYEA